MAKTSHLSRVIITQTTKPHAACARNLGARARKTDPGLNSPEYALSLPCLHTFRHAIPVADLEIQKEGFSHWRTKHRKKNGAATPTSGHVTAHD